MKKLLVFIVILAFSLTGCNFFSDNQEKPKNQVNTDQNKPPTGTNNTKPKEEPKEQPKEEIKEYFIGTKAQSKAIKVWAKRYQEFEGVYEQKIGKYRGVVVNLGVSLNSRTKVRIDKVTKLTNKWIVEVSLQEPSPGQGKEGIYYPHNIFSIINDGKPIEVIQNKNKQKKILPKVIIPVGKKLAVSENFLVITPLSNEKITSPVIIKGKARVFEANFRIHIEDGHYYLAEKILMADEGAPAYGNFSIKIPFKKPTNPQGFIILSYANMENGKMIEELVIPVKFK